MNTSDLYKLFREDVVDLEDPYLWSDFEVFSYMDDAQMMFCRFGVGIADVTTDAVVRVMVNTDEEYARIHESILYIRKAELVSTNRPIALMNLLEGPLQENDYGNIFNASTEHRPGPVRGMVIGEEYNKVRWVGVPQADDEVLLSVYRLPLRQITAREQEFEIRREHHYSLLAWMKHRAYGKQDAETFNRSKSEQHRDEFLGYCERAKAEWERYKHKPREIKYGGISGNFQGGGDW
jgi:hypothetical protein